MFYLFICHTLTLSLHGLAVTLSCTFIHPTRHILLHLNDMRNTVNVPCFSLALPAFTSQVVSSLQRSGGMYH